MFIFVFGSCATVSFIHFIYAFGFYFLSIFCIHVCNAFLNLLWFFNGCFLNGFMSQLLCCFAQTVIHCILAYGSVTCSPGSVLSSASCSKQRVLQLTDEQRCGGEARCDRVHARGAGEHHVRTHAEKHGTFLLPFLWKWGRSSTA